jgi:hypothetical protein
MSEIFAANFRYGSPQIRGQLDETRFKIMRIQKQRAYSNEVLNKTTNRLLTSKWLFLAILVMLMPSWSAFGQFESASVLGYTRDSSGAAIPNSTITLTNNATGITEKAKTDSEGRYEFSSVPIGNYTVTSEAAGFERAKTQTFTLTTDARQRVDVTMKPGSVSETVTVSALPTALETETSSRGQVIATQEIENLPLNGRSYADLALLVPGVRKSFLENQSTTTREASFNINGQRSAFNNFLLNGLDNNSYGTSNQGFANENIPPSPDAVSEFRLETDNYSAEYGRASGGVINASIRRGTNQFHGRAWDYIRNTDLNAIGPFAPTGGIKPTFIRNQFGGTFGGPIWKDHTFFFMDYEGVRQIFKSFAAATLPTAANPSDEPNYGQGLHQRRHSRVRSICLGEIGVCCPSRNKYQRSPRHAELLRKQLHRVPTRHYPGR